MPSHDQAGDEARPSHVVRFQPGLFIRFIWFVPSKIEKKNRPGTTLENHGFTPAMLLTMIETHPDDGRMP